MKKEFLIILAFTTLTLTACQSDETKSSPDLSKNAAADSQQETVVDHGKPFSSGPTSSPESSTGPTTPPPEKNPTAQAVTTNENIRLTLPRKTE